MTLHADLVSFIERHRPRGALTGDASVPTERGYLLTVACSCGVTFERWITPAEAQPTWCVPRCSLCRTDRSSSPAVPWHERDAAPPRALRRTVRGAAGRNMGYQEIARIRMLGLEPVRQFIVRGTPDLSLGQALALAPTPGRSRKSYFKFIPPPMVLSKQVTSHARRG